MLDTSPAHLRFARPPVLPVAELVRGKPAAEAAELVPRLFSLCRAAQALAMRLALGLPAEAHLRDALAAETVRDHVVKIALKWPAQLSCGALGLPQGWQAERAALRRAIFGPAGRAPAMSTDFAAWLESGSGAAPLLRRISQCFAGGLADTGVLDAVTAQSVFEIRAQENSIAGRHAAHPVLVGIAERHGHGPLWRATARIIDLDAALSDTLPDPVAPGPGRAVVPAARGLYAVSAGVQDGRVTEFSRCTPTDHLTVRGGILERALAALPADRAGLAPLLLDILDPCAPVTLREVCDA